MSEQSTDDTEHSGIFAKNLGETVFFGLGDEAVKGTVKEVERGTAVDEFPEVGETVTFKSVGGNVEKTVREVNPDDEHPIVLGHGGQYRRVNFVEYTTNETYRIVELEDGREVWPSTDDRSRQAETDQKANENDSA